MINPPPTSYEDIKDWTWDAFLPLAEELLATDVNADSIESWLDSWTQLIRLYYELGIEPLSIQLWIPLTN